jgi:hypothetical protein
MFHQGFARFAGYSGSKSALSRAQGLLKKVSPATRRSLQILIVLLVVTLTSDSLYSQSTGTLNGHTVRLDANGKLLAWGAVQGDAYDQVLTLATSFLLNGVPTASNGLKLYFTYSYAFPGNPVRPANWPHNPAGLYSMLTDSALAYYAYSGNAAIMGLVGSVLTYQLDHGMTPSNWNWPNVAFASGDAGALTYQGAHLGDSTGQGDGFGVIEPDKVGEIGVAFLKYYKYSGITRFRDAAIRAADVLSSHVRPGNATQSPWPFRVYGETNVVREEYSAHVISPIHLFDELIRLNLGNVSAYQTARQAAWNWLMTYPMQNNVWANYFEDVPIQSNTWNRNQLIAAETARYLMQHPELDPNWEAHARGLISWIESTFAQPQFGANTIAEQSIYDYPMGSHTSRYASVNALLYELTGDQSAQEKAYRSFNWATYMCRTNGQVIDSPEIGQIWWTDGYGDYIKHFMAGLGSVPEWAPQSQTHLLRSTSVVRSVQYSPGSVTYQTFDGAAQEVLRLNFTPQIVLADGVVLPFRGDLAQEGWAFDNSTGVLRVRHNTGTQIQVSGSLDTTLPDTWITGSPTSSSNSSSASFTFSSTVAGSSFQCKLDAGSVLACTSPQNYSGLASGSHTFQVRATDQAGNTDPTPATYTWTIDLTPATVTGVSPANGATVATSATVTAAFSEAIDPATISTITFELRDSSNALVSASVTYNATTRTATLTPSASLAFSTTYTASVKGGSTDPRVKDVAGNALAANVTWSFTTAASPTCPCTIWNSATTPGVVADPDTVPIEIGVKFRSDLNGYITSLRFYKSAANTGTHIGNLWTNAGTLLTSATFTNETASGWQQVNFPTPVAITAHTTYVASYHTTVGRYSADEKYFATTGVINPPLRALAAGVDGGNGVYKYGASGFPTLTYNASNYWVDVVFNTTTGPSDTTPPIISALNASPGTSGTATITWNTTNEAADSRVDYGTGPTSLTLNATNAALVTSHSITLTGLAPNTTYYYRVTSRYAAGNSSTAPPVASSPASFTTPAVTTVTAFPTSMVILSGTLRGGSAASLNVDDNSYFEVNSTTAVTRVTSSYGVFPGIPNSLSNLKITYKGKNSQSCTQRVAIWRWTTSIWVQLDSRSVGTTEVLINDLVPAGALADYVGGSSGNGELRVRVRCTTSAGNFFSSGDLMRIVYDRP